MSHPKNHSKSEDSFDSAQDQGDFVFEEANEDGETAAENNPALALKKLREKLKACQAEKQEYLEASQRLKADYVNLRKDTEKEKGEMARYAKAALLEEFLELADTFELAFGHREAWAKVDENWRRGVEYIYQKLVDIFRQNGLEPLEPVGEEFNPAEQHSVGLVPAERPEDDNRVLEVTQKGYKLNGRVIRPAKVKVGHQQ
jgi:molecular chaperone GrpE